VRVTGILVKEATVKGRHKTSVSPEICFFSAFFISTTGILAGMNRWVCRRNLNWHRINCTFVRVWRAQPYHTVSLIYAEHLRETGNEAT